MLDVPLIHLRAPKETPTRHTLNVLYCNGMETISPPSQDLFCNELPTKPRSEVGRILVTGATGYIGGRLVSRLLEAGHEVRCLVRDPEKLDQDPWRALVEIVQGDILEGATLDGAFEGCDVAYYLVHSMDGADRFAERDRTGAENFRKAAEQADL